MLVQEKGPIWRSSVVMMQPILPENSKNGRGGNKTRKKCPILTRTWLEVLFQLKNTASPFDVSCCSYTKPFGGKKKTIRSA
jgi:hypothetical protein